uniref:UBE2O-like tandem tSH3-B domain-containing protein n=1 Tax=Timema monikensis TaxID=170555 RepID=A0A7R9HSE3_9NEOP|nr:unnamed protein product [Timema monikensis]
MDAPRLLAHSIGRDTGGACLQECEFPSHREEFYLGQTLYGPLHVLEEAQWIHCTKELKTQMPKPNKTVKVLVEVAQTDSVAIHWQCRAYSKEGAGLDKEQPKFLLQEEDLQKMNWKSKIIFGVGEVGSLVGAYKIYKCMCPDDYVDNINEDDNIVDNINEDDNEDNVDDEEGERLFSLSGPIPRKYKPAFCGAHPHQPLALLTSLGTDSFHFLDSKISGKYLSGNDPPHPPVEVMNCKSLGMDDVSPLPCRCLVFALFLEAVLSSSLLDDEPPTLGEAAQPVGPNSLDQLLNNLQGGYYWDPYGLDEGLRDNVAAKRWVCRWLPKLQQAPRAVLGMTSRTSSGQPPVNSYQPLASSPRRPSRLRPQKAAEIRPPMFGVIWTLSTA